jgi:hypothetical protein
LYVHVFLFLFLDKRKNHIYIYINKIHGIFPTYPPFKNWHITHLWTILVFSLHIFFVLSINSLLHSVLSYYPILTLKFVNDFEVFLYVGYCPLVLTILTQMYHISSLTHTYFSLFSSKDLHFNFSSSLFWYASSIFFPFSSFQILNFTFHSLCSYIFLYLIMSFISFFHLIFNTIFY